MLLSSVKYKWKQEVQWDKLYIIKFDDESHKLKIVANDIYLDILLDISLLFARGISHFINAFWIRKTFF